MVMVHAFHIGKGTTESHQTGLLEEGCSISLPETGEDGGGSHPHTCLLVLRHFELLMEILFGWGLELELPVMLHDESCLLVVKPIGFTLVDECLRLCIDLFMVGTHTDIDRSCQFYPDETAVSCRVSKDISDIRRSDEGGKAWEVLNMFAVGSASLSHEPVGWCFSGIPLGRGAKFG